jgi:hypothetical protein
MRTIHRKKYPPEPASRAASSSHSVATKALSCLLCALLCAALALVGSGYFQGGAQQQKAHAAEGLPINLYTVLNNTKDSYYQALNDTEKAAIVARTDLDNVSLGGKYPGYNGDAAYTDSPSVKSPSNKTDDLGPYIKGISRGYQNYYWPLSYQEYYALNGGSTKNDVSKISSFNGSNRNWLRSAFWFGIGDANFDRISAFCVQNYGELTTNLAGSGIYPRAAAYFNLANLASVDPNSNAAELERMSADELNQKFGLKDGICPASLDRSSAPTLMLGKVKWYVIGYGGYGVGQQRIGTITEPGQPMGTTVGAPGSAVGYQAGCATIIQADHSMLYDYVTHGFTLEWCHSGNAKYPYYTSDDVDGVGNDAGTGPLVTPAPTEPPAAPTDPDPVDPAPIDPDPVDPTPSDPSPADPDPVEPAPSPSDPVPTEPQLSVLEAPAAVVMGGAASAATPANGESSVRLELEEPVLKGAKATNHGWQIEHSEGKWASFDPDTHMSLYYDGKRLRYYVEYRVGEKTYRKESNPVTIQVKPNSLYPTIGGPDRIATSAKTALDAWPSGSKYAVLAIGSDFKDALAASYLAGHLDAPVLLVSPQLKNNARIKATLKTLKVTKVYTIGAAVTDTIRKSVWTGAFEKVSSKGKDGVTEAIDIVKYVTGTLKKAKPTFVLITTTSGFADAMGTAAYAANPKLNMPILYVDGNNNASKASAFVKSLGSVKTTYVLGSTVSVSAAAAKKFPAVKRVYGADRNATAAAAFATFSPMVAKANADGRLHSVGMAAASGFADALGAGAAQAHLGGVVMITPPAKVGTNVKAALNGGTFKSGSTTYRPVAVHKHLIDFCFYGLTMNTAIKKTISGYIR